MTIPYMNDREGHYCGTCRFFVECDECDMGVGVCDCGGSDHCNHVLHETHEGCLCYEKEDES